jgi:hypothetical protein
MKALFSPVLTLAVTNGADHLDVSQFWDGDFKSSGMTDFVYTPPSASTNRDAWPTLGSMIDSGKRVRISPPLFSGRTHMNVSRKVVVFMDTGADTSKVPYILPEFDNVRHALNF